MFKILVSRFFSKICRYDSHRHEEPENDDDINIQKTINTNSGAEDDSAKKKKKKKDKKKSKKGQEKGSKKGSKVNTDAEEQSGDVSQENNNNNGDSMDSIEIQVPIEQTVKLSSVELEPTITVKGLDVTDDENTESLDNSMEVAGGENKVVEAEAKRLISTETTTSTESFEWFGVVLGCEIEILVEFDLFFLSFDLENLRNRHSSRFCYSSIKQFTYFYQKK